MHVNFKIDSRLRQQCSKLYNIVVGVLSLAPCYVRKKQVRAVDPDCISTPNISSFVGHGLMNGAVAPCKLVKTNQKFYICSDGTHTHTCVLACQLACLRACLLACMPECLRVCCVCV